MLARERGDDFFDDVMRNPRVWNHFEHLPCGEYRINTRIRAGSVFPSGLLDQFRFCLAKRHKNFRIL